MSNGGVNNFKIIQKNWGVRKNSRLKDFELLAIKRKDWITIEYCVPTVVCSAIEGL